MAASSSLSVSSASTVLLNRCSTSTSPCASSTSSSLASFRVQFAPFRCSSSIFPPLAFVPRRRQTIAFGGCRRGQRQVVHMAPEEEKLTRRNPLDFPIEWERPKPGRRPDIFPQFSPMKTPLPPPLPCDPPEEDEEEEEKKEEEEEEPEKEAPEEPDKKA